VLEQSLRQARLCLEVREHTLARTRHQGEQHRDERQHEESGLRQRCDAFRTREQVAPERAKYFVPPNLLVVLELTATLRKLGEGFGIHHTQTACERTKEWRWLRADAHDAPRTGLFCPYFEHCGLFFVSTPGVERNGAARSGLAARVQPAMAFRVARRTGGARTVFEAEQYELNPLGTIRSNRERVEDALCQLTLREARSRQGDAPNCQAAEEEILMPKQLAER